MNLVPDDSSAANLPVPGAPPARAPQGVKTAPASAGPPAEMPPRTMPDRVSPIVAEIRERLSEITARELALRRREREIDQQYRRLEQMTREAVQRELQEARRQLEDRAAEVDAEATDLVVRRQRLDRREAELENRQGHQDQSQTQFLHALETERQRLEAERARLDTSKQTLVQRIQTLRRREKDLAQRIQLARDDVMRQRAELAVQREGFQRETTELERQWRNFEESTAEEDQHWAALQMRAKELDRQQAELEARRTELEQERADFQGATRAVEQERQILPEKQRELEKETRAARDQRRQLAKQAEELETRRREQQQQQTALEERVRKLEAREREFREQAAGLEAESNRLAELETRVETRRKSIDALHEKAGETEKRVFQQQEEILALRDQIEARDAESRQIAMAQELERQELDREQAALTLAQEESDQMRGQRETDFQQAHETLQKRFEELARSERSVLAAPRRWRLRGMILATTTAVMAAAGWWYWDRPLYRCAAEIRIQSEARAPQRMAREHAAALLTPGQAENDLQDGRLARSWAAARQAGQVEAMPIADPPAVRLSLAFFEANEGCRLVQTVAEGYARRINETPAAPVLPAMYADLEERRHGAAAELKATNQRQAEAQALFATAPNPGERDQILAEVRQLRETHAETVKTLENERVKLVTLLAGDIPQENADPAAYERTLADDAPYQEDLKELQVQAKQYQTELAIAMVLLTDPLKEMQKALETFAATLVEQRNLNPPPAIGALLEPCSAQIEQFETRLKEFSHDWSERRAGIERLKPEQNLVELVDQQSKVADAVRKLVEDLKPLMGELRTQLDKLNDQSGGATRGVVIAAVLRGDLGRLEETVSPLIAAAGAIDLAVNFRLNACDRQLRGLRQRLTQRQELLRQQVQMEADRASRQQRENQLVRVREAVAKLEEQRETAVTTLVDKLDALRGLDEELRQRRALESEMQRNETESARLETQLRRLDEALAEARRAGPRPDRVAVLEPWAEQIAGAQRVRHTAYAAVGAFALAWLTCLLMIVKSPSRRRATRAMESLGIVGRAEA